MPTRERRAKALGISVDRLPDGRGRHANHACGPKHYRWQEQKIVSDEGYIKVRVGAEHPLADPNGYAYEHLLVWAAAGRQPPSAEEVLHHRDENRQNNRLDNLELLTRSRHGKHHITDRARDQTTGQLLPKPAGALLDGREHREFPQ